MSKATISPRFDISYETGNMIMECTENACPSSTLLDLYRNVQIMNSIKFVSLLSKFLKEETMTMRRTNLGKT